MNKGAISILTIVLMIIGTSRHWSIAQDKPNILWLTSEDNSAEWLGCYGNPKTKTPNLDQLASEGFRYTNAYSNGPSCSPSRSTWITGIMSVSMGTHHQRCFHMIPHDEIKYYTDFLREAGYYTGNDEKTDYNIAGREHETCWDNLGKTDWEAMKNQQPFFQVINKHESHSSKLRGDIENTRESPDNVDIPSFHPDRPDMRKNYALYYDCIENMDTAMGKLLQKLEEMGLADNTIVIYNSDHGGAMPLGKGHIFHAGIHCPLIVRIPEKYKHLWPAEKPGSTVDRMVSFVDMPKTWISLAGVTPPEYMQGTTFLGPKTEAEPQYHFSFRGRQADAIDNSRTLCDKQYLYIRNYMPYVPWMQFWMNYWNIRATQVWEEAVLNGSASEVQSRFFMPKGWTEELYDMKNDPECVNNLISSPAHQSVAIRMRKAMRQKQIDIHDAGLLPEMEISRLAKKHNLTIYELARTPEFYNVEKLLDAADLALKKNPKHLPKLREMMESTDIGQRYWGMIGCFLLNDSESATKGIIDESDEIKAMAAWLLIRTGKKSEGKAVLRRLIEQNSYATFTTLDMMLWMGDECKDLMPVVRKMDPKKLNPKQIGFVRDYLMEKYPI